MNITARPATPDDVKFLARTMELSMLPVQGQGLFDEMSDAIGMDRLSFHEAALLARASNWGQLADAVVVEVDGEPGAASSAHLSNMPDIRPMTMAQVQSLSRHLGLSPEESKTLLRAYIGKFGAFGDLPHLRHPAEYVLEFGAALPHFAGLRLTKYVYGAHVKRALDRGCKTMGALALVGNNLSLNGAKRLGLNLHSTVTADDVGGGFIGMHRLVLDLTDLAEGYEPGEPLPPVYRRQ